MAVSSRQEAQALVAQIVEWHRESSNPQGEWAGWRGAAESVCSASTSNFHWPIRPNGAGGPSFITTLLEKADKSLFTRAAARGDERFVEFRVLPDRIDVEFNEDGFSALDVRGVCKVPVVEGFQGRMRSGHFLNSHSSLRSVFQVAHKVHIQSGHFSFSFRHDPNIDPDMGLITPEWEDPADDFDLTKPLTRFTLFLKDRRPRKKGSHRPRKKKSRGPKEWRGQTAEQQFADLDREIAKFLEGCEMIQSVRVSVLDKWTKVSKRFKNPRKPMSPVDVAVRDKRAETRKALVQPLEDKLAAEWERAQGAVV